jgi:hypothetical protein
VRLTLSILLLLSGCEDPAVTPVRDLSFNPDLAMPPMAAVLTETTTLTNCIALDGANVYWIESSDTNIPDAGALGRLMKVSKLSGTPSLLADAVDSPGCAVADEENVYVTRGGDILKVPLSGGAATPIASNQHVLPMSTPRLAAHGGFVYWITDVYGPTDAFSGKNALVRVSRAGGGTVESLFTDVTGSPGGIAVDATNVYYSDQNGMYLRPINMGNGGAAVPIGISTLHNNRFAVDDMHLVVDEVSGIGAGDLAVFKLDGSGRAVIHMEMASALAIDHASVYANVGGKLSQLAIDGSGSQTLDDRGPRAIALDATDIYFTDGSSILRFAK